MSSFPRFLLKVLVLYLLVNLLFGLASEWNIGAFSLYNHIYSGRMRFPFGETPQEAYNFSLFNLDAMFASHEIVAIKHSNEYRILIIGDSSVWGTLLKPEETLAGQLNAKNLKLGDNRQVHFYNLGYPTISLTKDLLILDQAQKYQPDMVIWLMTLEAFPIDKQLAVPLVENNPREVLTIIDRYNLNFGQNHLTPPTFWESTFIGRRKELADLFRMQAYGIMWAATGIDQVYPTEYPLAAVDLDENIRFHAAENWDGPINRYLAFEPIESALRQAGKTQFLLVNEPILVSTGKNSDLRYNFYYPRWAYDRYLAEMEVFTQKHQVDYLNAWNTVPSDQFTNSAIHINRDGVTQLSEAISARLLQMWAKPVENIGAK